MRLRLGQVRTGKPLAALAIVVFLSACGSDNPRLLNIRSSSDGPDEFAIVPNRPLEAPENFSALPPPTPGRANRVDQNPNADAIAALGGRPGVAATIPAQDAGLLASVSRYGVEDNIRGVLAAEDLEFRRRKDGRLLERLFGTNVYYRAYAPQSLNKYRELERFRGLGVRTPAAPPRPR